MVALNIVEGQDGIVKEWHDKNQYTFPVLLGLNMQTAIEDYELQATPLNFLLDSEGRIVNRFEGYTAGGEKKIETAIRSLLKLD